MATLLHVWGPVCRKWNSTTILLNAANQVRFLQEMCLFELLLLHFGILQLRQQLRHLVPELRIFFVGLVEILLKADNLVRLILTTCFGAVASAFESATTHQLLKIIVWYHTVNGTKWAIEPNLT